MTVLDRSELQASPLADLHLIADQVGLEGFRRLRKADLIDAILGEQGAGDGLQGEESSDNKDGEAPKRRSRARRPARSRRAASAGKSGESEDEQDELDELDEKPDAEKPAPVGRASRAAGGQRGQGARGRPQREKSEDGERVAEGVVEVAANGSAFLRVPGPEPSDGDVYISAAQVRRCELVSGDRVSGPVRLPRRSERHPSLVRIETINGEPADSVAEGTHYDELAVSFASERLAFDSEDPTLKAIEWLTPLGRGSRAVIVGGARSGKSETLRAILGALAGREGLELSLVLAGARPEEIGEWREGPVAPAVALSFAVSPEARVQAIEPVIETAKRVAARGGDAIVLIDCLDGLPPHSARKLLAAARKLTDGGSLTVIATSAEPLGGETTVIALDALRTSTGRLPALDLVSSGTLKPELLVGEEGAQEITRARATAAEG
ncbi:MAG TPA: Rho termination factor N-terminal domain-containing protein [Solirubrobacteraceae bacterium]|jgi:transcription termination factor Rho|nr:Rho termination factor N-terminal domain-containing protein [Solirubrobacteraceae bacterium]